MENTSPRIRSLLRQADRVASSGKRAAAEQLYRQIVDEAPQTPAAWLALAALVNDPAEKGAALQQVLALEPDNETAQTGLQALAAGLPWPGAEEAEAAEKEVAENTSDETHQWLESSTAAGRYDDILGGAPQPKSPAPAETAPPEEHDHAAEEEVSGVVLSCANHPGRETSLRCSKCGKPICSRCAKPTPVGYRCPQCIREREDLFYNATTADYIVAAIFAFPLGIFSGLLALQIGFFVIFLAPIAGGIIGQVIFRLVGRRRGRWLPHLVASAVVVGGLLPAFPILLFFLAGRLQGGISLLYLGLYIVLATGAAYYRMK